MSRCEKKLAGLEALVPEELEKHLILNSNRLRTFEDARWEIVTCVEAKFGLRLRDSNPSDAGFRECSDPMDVGSTLSRRAKEKGYQIRAMGVLSAVQHISNENAIQARTLASNGLANSIIASHGPRVSLQSQAKERVKRTKEIQRTVQRNQETSSQVLKT